MEIQQLANERRGVKSCCPVKSFVAMISFEAVGLNNKTSFDV